MKPWLIVAVIAVFGLPAVPTFCGSGVIIDPPDDKRQASIEKIVLNRIMHRLTPSLHSYKR